MPYSDCGQVHRFQEVALVLPLQEQTKWKLSKSVIDVWEAGSIAWIASHLMACSPELMVGPDEGSAICVWWDPLSFSGNIFHEEFVSRTLFNEHALVKVVWTYHKLWKKRYLAFMREQEVTRRRWLYCDLKSVLFTGLFTPVTYCGFGESTFFSCKYEEGMVFHLLPQNINVYFCCSSAYHGEYLCSIFATGKNEATGLIIKKSLTIGVIYDAIWLIL